MTSERMRYFYHDLFRMEREGELKHYLKSLRKKDYRRWRSTILVLRSNDYRVWRKAHGSRKFKQRR